MKKKKMQKQQNLCFKTSDSFPGGPRRTKEIKTIDIAIIRGNDRKRRCQRWTLVRTTQQKPIQLVRNTESQNKLMQKVIQMLIRC